VVAASITTAAASRACCGATTRHLHNLATAARTPAPPAREFNPEVVPETTLRLLRTVTAPTLVLGRFFDVLAWSPLAGTLLGEVTRLPQNERNVLSLLLRPEADKACPDRAASLAVLTAMLRIQVTAYPEDPRDTKLIRQLAAQSDEFATLWARHDVEEPARGRMRVIHPLVGELVLDWDAYPIPGALGLLLLSTPPRSPASTPNASKWLPVSTPRARRQLRASRLDFAGGSRVPQDSSKAAIMAAACQRTNAWWLQPRSFTRRR
jgi:hypothetical protein